MVLLALYFLAALDEYNKRIEEDNKTNRFEESLNMFTEITSKENFYGKTFILFLNKSDLFEEKIKKFPISDHFEVGKEYDVFENAVGFIKQKYVEAYRGNPDSLNCFVTNSLDTDRCKKVFKAIRDDVFLKKLMKN